MTLPDSAILTRNLCKDFGQARAVDNLNLTVPTATVFGMVGANGAGKTTTMRMLVDLLRPSSGEIRVLGENPREGGVSLRRRIGYLPGELNLDGKLSGKDLLRYFAQLSAPVNPRFVAELVERLQVDLAKQVRRLSKGNKQKIGVIQAFMHRPDLVILDEPTSGLDPLAQKTVLELVDEARQAGQTVLLSSHVLSEIQRSADALIVLSHGKVVAQGDVASLRLSALRQVEIVTNSDSYRELATAIKELPDTSEVGIRRPGERVHLTFSYRGSAQSLIAGLNHFPITDLLITEPTLEESVLSLYEEGNES